MRTSVGGLALALGLVACAGSGASRHIHQPGDVTGSPRVEALPSLDVGLDALTAEMRMARLLSAEALDLPPPAHPADTSSATFSAWSDRELKDWMREKHKRAEAARRELDLAAAQSHRQRIMAGALVGLVYEDVARALMSLPVPRELISEPEIAAMYVDILRSQAAPYLLEARQAYTACAGNAEQMEALAHWSDFCASREELLPAGAPGPVEREGHTTVRVVRR